ncbi:glycosyltransferase family 2 protein [Rouxiella sp. WC2420]|uniref:Glycosyltransferase family 2 protein n=1 Tax=Rouxiella sp. WC2420 TaxID=3234145 RepID=A0AB39VWQ8_9GAMM
MDKNAERISVSCIIPAHNEARRIGKVLDAVVGHPLIGEIIVVDDCSSDDTAAQAQRDGVKLIPLPQNLGKSGAVASGIAAASGSHLLLLDADLVGLTANDINALLQSVLSQQVDVSLSLRRNSPRLWHLIGLDYISGERVFPRSLVASRLAEIRALANFGLEVWLNRLWIAENYRIAVVHWPDVISPYKAQKMGWLRGIKADCAMTRDILRTISPRQILQQIMAMKRQSPPLPQPNDASAS